MEKDKDKEKDEQPESENSLNYESLKKVQDSLHASFGKAYPLPSFLVSRKQYEKLKKLDKIQERKNTIATGMGFPHAYGVKVFCIEQKKDLQSHLRDKREKTLRWKIHQSLWGCINRIRYYSSLLINTYKKVMSIITSKPPE